MLAAAIVRNNKLKKLILSYVDRSLIHAQPVCIAPRKIHEDAASGNVL
jgi:hypothetical protein